MRTVLIHHDDSLVDHDVVAPWIASFSELAGLVVIGEPRSNRLGRIRRELRRSGLLGFIDVLAFRLYYSIRFAKSDRRWEADTRARLARRLPDPPSAIPTLVTHDPNSAETRQFICDRQPDLIVARCRVLLAKEIFSIPPLGTFVMHPGITPEYRNSHGCFWALSNRDLERVGLSLVQIDEGVDTGPVFGYFTYAYDERRETHDVIQKRMLLENLDGLRDRLLEIERGEARPIDTSGRESGVWGQPRLTSYIRWKRAASTTGSLRAATILYHDVVEAGEPGSSGFQGAGPDRYKLDLSDFQEHLETLDERVSSAPTSVSDAVNGQGLPWLLTFDDGGSSAVRIGEMLAERRWPGHFFITVDYIGTDGFVSEDEVRALEGMGHVIGSHSCSHPERMAHCSWAQLEEEWGRSVDALSRIVGHPVETASVPGGDYNRTVARAAAAAGIRHLFTSEPVLRVRAVDGCSVFGRFSIVRGVPAERAVEFARGRRAPIWSQFTSWQAKKAVKTIGGRHYLKLRRLALEKRR